MKLKAKKALRDLTNEFLTKFAETAKELDKGNTESYSFNYLLMFALAQSNFVNNRQKETGFPTPSGGINLFTNLFEVNIQDLFEHLKFIFDNIDSQLDDDDKIKNLKFVDDVYHFNVENQNVKLKCLLKTDNGVFKHLSIFKGKELIHSVELGYLIDGDVIDSTNKNEEFILEKAMAPMLYLPEHFQFTYIRDINSFYSTIENIYLEIKDEL